MLLRATLVGISLFGSCLSAYADDASWNTWRGPNRDGLVPSTSKAWPDKLDGLTRLWQVTDLGPSYSGPVLTDKLIFTTETVAKKTERVTAYDRATGKQLWKTEWEGAMEVPFFAARNGSWIRATPAVDGDRLYVAGIRDLLVCLDTATGKVNWKVDFTKEFESPVPTFGCVSSPLISDQFVYVQAGSGFVKLDKMTGKVAWRVLKDEGGMMGSAFSSPLLTTISGQKLMVVQTRTRLAGVEPGDGKVVWEKPIPSFRGMNILTPINYQDAIFTSTYGGNTRLIGFDKSQNQLMPTDKWTIRYEGNMCSPVIVNDHAYFLGKDQRFICIDLASGKEKWRTDRRFGQYWSIVANKDKLLALDQTGTLYLIKANPNEFELLSEKKVAESESWAHIAISDDLIYIRDLNSLMAYRWK